MQLYETNLNDETNLNAEGPEGRKAQGSAGVTFANGNGTALKFEMGCCLHLKGRGLEGQLAGPASRVFTGTAVFESAIPLNSRASLSPPPLSTRLQIRPGLCASYMRGGRPGVRAPHPTRKPARRFSVGMCLCRGDAHRRPDAEAGGGHICGPK